MGLTLFSSNALLAERALQLFLEPVVNALAVELMRAIESLDHDAVFEGIQAYGAVLLIAFGLFVLEGGVAVYYVSDLLGGELGLLFFILFSIILVVPFLKLLLVGGRELEALAIRGRKLLEIYV